jgi:hypothetical protein
MQMSLIYCMVAARAAHPKSNQIHVNIQLLA